MEIDDQDLGVEGAGQRSQASLGATDQLSLDVGPTGDRYDGKPIFPTYSVAGSMSAKKQLNQGDEVVVTVSGPDGEILSVGRGRVDVSFKDIEQKGTLVGVERRHAAKIIAGE